jgi:hypothetical protein
MRECKVVQARLETGTRDGVAARISVRGPNFTEVEKKEESEREKASENRTKTSRASEILLFPNR